MKLLLIHTLDPKPIHTYNFSCMHTYLHYKVGSCVCRASEASGQGPVLVSLGIIDDLEAANLQKGRKLLAQSLKKLRRKEEVAKIEQAGPGRVPWVCDLLQALRPETR